MNVVHSTYFTHSAPDKTDMATGRRHQAKVLASLPLAGNQKAIDRLKAKKPQRLSRVPVRQRLQGLLGRAETGCNAGNLGVVKPFLEAALAAVESKDARQKLGEMVAAAQAGDKTEQANLARTIAVNVGHLVRAASNWIQWYQTFTLQPDETAYLRNYVPQTGNIRVGTANGTLTTVDISPDEEDDTMVNLFFLLSDVYRATVFDPHKGFIAEAALGTIEISLDLAEKIDALLQLPFTVGTPNSIFTAAFVNNGTPAANFHLSARIYSGNLPAGNIISAVGNGVGTKPRLACIQAIDDYFARYGSGFDVDGDMVPVAVHCASGVASQFGDEFNAGSAQNAYTDKLFQNRRMLSYNGINYTIVPDLTIDPNDKHLYVRSNLPAGAHFEKPAGSKVSRVEQEMENEVLTWERCLIGDAFPVTWVPRALAVKFKS